MSDCQCDTCKACPYGGYGYMGSSNYFGHNCSVDGAKAKPNEVYRHPKKLAPRPAGGNVGLHNIRNNRRRK